MVTAEEVVQIYRLITGQGIPLWLNGGWGIDALLQVQTRTHKDLDVLILADDVLRVQEILTAQGYQLKMLWEENKPGRDSSGCPIETAFVFHDEHGREFDAHAIRLDPSGNGIPAWDADDFIFTHADLSGTGQINGHLVSCLTPQSQVVCHTGYDLPETHQHDMHLLQAHFGLPDPDQDHHS